MCALWAYVRRHSKQSRRNLFGIVIHTTCYDYRLVSNSPCCCRSHNHASRERSRRLRDGPTLWNLADWCPVMLESLTPLRRAILSAPIDTVHFYKHAFIRGDVFRVLRDDSNGKKTTQRYFAARFQRTFRSSNRDQQPMQGLQLRCAELMDIYVVK